MEMIQNMPESSYELSLKDIVNDSQSLQGVQQDKDVERKIKQMKKNPRKGQMFRSESMDSGVFLLKMFLPTSLRPKKKSSSGNRSEVSSTPSFAAPEKLLNKAWRAIRSPAAVVDRNLSRIGSSDITDNRSRQVDNSTPRCWPSNSKNSKSGRLRGCLF